MERLQNKNNLWLGIVFLIVGGAYLLDNFDLIPRFVPYWVFSWKMLFVIIGGSMLLTGHRGGFFFLIFGGLFLFPHILDYPRFYIRDWWPVLLVILGVYIMIRNRKSDYPTVKGEPTAIGDDYINETAILGGGTRVVTSKKFRGGKITSIFGGSEIYLQQAELGEGPVVIDIFVLFGGTTLVVPPDWTIKSEAFVALGGFNDGRRVFGKPEKGNEKEIIIRGFVMFGGGEIKSA